MLVVDKAAAVARVVAANPLPIPVEQAVEKPTAVSDEQQLQQALQAWAAAWQEKNAGAYLAWYAADFKPANGAARAAWVQQRRALLAKTGSIELKLEHIKVKLLDKDQASIEFRQTYRSNNFQDVVTKILHWRREAGRWLITQELTAK